MTRMGRPTVTIPALMGPLIARTQIPMGLRMPTRMVNPAGIRMAPQILTRTNPQTVIHMVLLSATTLTPTDPTRTRLAPQTLAPTVPPRAAKQNRMALLSVASRTRMAHLNATRQTSTDRKTRTRTALQGATTLTLLQPQVATRTDRSLMGLATGTLTATVTDVATISRIFV